MAYRIAVTRTIPEPGISIARSIASDFLLNEDDRVLSRDELLQYVAGRDGVLCLLTDTIDAAVFEAAGPQCKIFANYAVGFNNVDVAEATRRGVLVTNTPGVLTDATADIAWTLLLSAARRVTEADPFMRGGHFQGWGPMMYLGGDIAGRTLGIVGAGRIGSAVAERSVGFRMRVLYADVNPNPELEAKTGACRVEMDELLRQSDYVSLHVNLCAETTHLIGARELSLMKPTAYLINTARGPVVDEVALVAALKAGTIAGAGLDVYEDEPLMKPGLAECPNTVLLPHIASATVWTRSKMAEMAATNLVAALNGEVPPNLVNPEALGK